METVKLNCAACGAPIVIPEGVENLVCTSCNSSLAVNRGEGYISLKVAEKLAESIHVMGEKTSSAIKENSFVTQVELKRMQLNQLISMEEMKINTLQAEIRAVKRRTTDPLTLSEELGDLLLQDNDVRMHIRSLKEDIARLEPGWEESLDVIRRDGLTINEAFNALSPYSQFPTVRDRISVMTKEKIKNENAYDRLDAKLLRNELAYFKYPLFEKLSLEQMEELQQKIPLDLKVLKSRDASRVNYSFQNEMNATLTKINQVYPRKKVESLAGKLGSIDMNGPYPEEPAKLQPLIDQVRTDIVALEKIPESVHKKQFMHMLSEKLNFLVNRAQQDIPAAKARTRKKNLVASLLGIGIFLGFIVALVIVIVVAINRSTKNNTKSEVSGLVENLIGATNRSTSMPTNSNAVIEPGGQYEPFEQQYFEVTSRTTYFRDTPKVDATETFKVERGDIVLSISDGSLPEGWYKVSTIDGSNIGYLAGDWVRSIWVSAVAGETLQTTYVQDVVRIDFSTEHWNFPVESENDNIAATKLAYQDGMYVLDVTANDAYIYYYANQEVEDLPEEYTYSLVIQPIQLDTSVYYGLQTSVVDENNFDAVLIAPEGNILILTVRNGDWTILYDTSDPLNTKMTVNLTESNILSVVRLVDTSGNVATYRYAINGRVFVEVLYENPGEPSPVMGTIVYIVEKGDRGVIRIDDFLVTVP